MNWMKMISRFSIGTWKKTTINWRDVPGRDDLWKSDILSYVKEAAFAQEFDNQF